MTASWQKAADEHTRARRIQVADIAAWVLESGDLLLRNIRSESDVTPEVVMQAAAHGMAYDIAAAVAEEIKVIVWRKYRLHAVALDETIRREETDRLRRVSQRLREGGQA